MRFLMVPETQFYYMHFLNTLCSKQSSTAISRSTTSLLLHVFQTTRVPMVRLTSLIYYYIWAGGGGI